MLLLVDFGADKAGIATVGYTLLEADGTESAARTTTGVVDIDNGQYQVEVTPPTGAVTIVWDTGEAVPLYASESIWLQEELRKVPRRPIAADAGANFTRNVVVDTVPALTERYT